VVRTKGQLPEILVEGYHDAVFLASSCQHFGVTDPRTFRAHPKYIVPITPESLHSFARKVLVCEDSQTAGSNG
jgi:hypothetical protein